MNIDNETVNGICDLMSNLSLDSNSNLENSFVSNVSFNCINNNDLDNNSLNIDNDTQSDCTSNNKASCNYLGVRVVNLSNYKLNKSEVSVLEKGITFSPTPGECDISETHHEVQKFLRRILLKVHFHDNVDTANNSYYGDLPKGLLKFKPQSKWTPRSSDPILRAFIYNVEKDLSTLKPIHSKQFNLTRMERQSLKTLESNKDIIIKKADKGSSVVVMNKEDYIKEALRQLSDTNFYIETDRDLTKEHNDEIEKTLSDLLTQELITEPIYRCITNNNPRKSSLYLLPKIHKIKQEGQFPAGRPIISANQSPTEKISAFVDENIKGAVPRIPSHIKDTTHFISLIESISIPDNCFLVTLDVTSLYTNIPNNEGLEAVAKSMIKNKPPYTTPECVLHLLELVLTKNNFGFNGKNYLQIGGTAMGTKVAPSYANLFMGELEKNILECSPKEPLLWKRFIDDIFMIWTYSQKELHTFLEYLNRFHHSIKFTMEYSDKQIVFLDTIVKKSTKNNRLIVELYTKPTDTHNYLHFQSYHPSHTKRGGPYGQFLRVRRNCTLDSDYEKHSSYIKDKYIQRGYPVDLVENSRLKALQCDRKDLLNPDRSNKQNKTDKNVLPLILKHHPSNYQVHKIIMDNWGLLKYSDLCKNALPEKPLFVSRRNTNLKDVLIRSRLEPDPGPVNIWKPCRNFYCTLCATLRTNKYCLSTMTKRRYKTPSFARCRTTNVIYMLTCSVCHKQYIGETKRPFCTRLKEHLADIRLNRDRPVSTHINLHNKHRHVIFPQILEVINRDPEKPETTIFRKKREIFWIYRMKTLLPHGLNKLGSG